MDHRHFRRSGPQRPGHRRGRLGKLFPKIEGYDMTSVFYRQYPCNKKSMDLPVDGVWARKAAPENGEVSQY